MAEPRFVRLAEHLTRGGRYDINSGFGISGYDVVPMPDKDETPNAYKFVRGELAAGRLEGASKAEYDEAHPDIAGALGYKVADTEDEARPYQEREVQAIASKIHRKVKSRRAAVETEDAFDADQRRREATLEAQRAQDGRATARTRARSAAEAEDAAQAEANAALAREAAARSTGGGRAQVQGASDVEDDEDDEDGDDAYESMGKKALTEEAKRRGLPHSGNAGELRDRLRADDDPGEDDDEDDSDEDEPDDDTEDDTATT